MTNMTGAEALTKSIQQYGIDTIFALPGVQLDHLFDALYHHQDSIRVIHTRHEQATAYMAFGYAQATGRVGTSLVVPGPGLLNATAALSTAHGCNAPVLCLAGQMPSKYIGSNTGQLHELLDQPGAVKSVTKWQGRALSPSTTPQTVQDAFAQLNSGHRRPVLLEMAPDIMAKKEDVDLLDPLTDFSTFEPEPDPDLVEQAASLLGNAENPAIYVGGGIFGAEEELLALAEEIQAPVFMSPHGQGAVDSRHYLGLNLLSAFEMKDDIDVILTAGTRFQTPQSWGVDDEVKVIRIDPIETLPALSQQADIHIASTARKSLKELLERSRRHNRKRPSREEELTEMGQTMTDRFAQLEHQHAYSSVIREELPDDGIACFGVTQVGFYSWFGFPTYSPRTNIQAGHQGTLGYGFPTALGAQVAHPDKKVVAVTGDGGFMFNVQELATAAQHGINLVTILFNDGHFGNVKRNQDEGFGSRYIASELQNPDFMKLADSFGVMGQRVNSPEGMRTALQNAFKEDAPALIEVQVGEFPSAWKYMPLVRARDQVGEKKAGSFGDD